MCGILGIQYSGRRPDRAAVEAALNTMSYRGPDATGHYYSPDNSTMLGHRRLSIIDLSESANQPMSSIDGHRHLVYNGEIYNFQSIRQELEAEGVEFRTRSDSEVLLESYTRWGPSCLERFIGMFAFCVYDDRDGSFFLARDRMGKKPLFYSFGDGGGGHFAFSSELKALMALGVLDGGVDPAALEHYLSLGYVPWDMCLATGANKLPAGHYLMYTPGRGEPVTQMYWDTPELGEPLSEAEALEGLTSILLDSVRMRLVSDVPLGAFLSGGVDSSLIVSLMREAHNGPLKTFSVGFEGSSSNELAHAAKVAEYLDTEHTEIMVTPQVRDDLEYVSGELDEPIYDSSLLPTYYLCKHTRKHVTVALSGDGGDELFAGYIHYHSALRARQMSSLLPGPLKGLAALAANMMPEGAFGRNTLIGASVGGKGAFLSPQQVFNERERSAFISTGHDPLAMRAGFMDRYPDFINAMCYTDMRTGMVDDILVKVDRASMLNSLEVRCPILDHRVAEFAFSRVPSGLKLNGGIKKYLLKRLAKKRLPASLELERKQGFDIPADLLYRTDLAQRIMDFPDGGLLDMGAVRALARKQIEGRGMFWHKLFAIYYLLRWHETWKS